MRWAGEIDFDWVTDYTRWMRRPDSYSSLGSLLRLTAETYRRSLWDNQDAYVEVWLEKDALSGVLLPVTAQWDVPLMVTRGYPSLSFLHGAAVTIARQDRPTYLYYFGDYDPSGMDIPRAVERGIRKFAPRADLTFERVAVTPRQISKMRLPTRPTKATDSRSKSFKGESVEVDAIPPRDLRRMVEQCITRHVDQDQLARLHAIEAEEKATLAHMVHLFGDPETDDNETGEGGKM
jgi:hypothetical protein